MAISHLDDVEYAQHAYEQALRLNAKNITTDPINLLLNYSVSLFNHKKYSDAHKKLVEVYKMIERNGSGFVVEEDVRFKNKLCSIIFSAIFYFKVFMNI